MLAATLMLGLLADATVVSQQLDVTLRPEAHEVAVRAALRVRGEGRLRLRLADAAEIDTVRLDGAAVEYDRAPGDAAGPGVLALEAGPGVLAIAYHARLEEDVASGERPGQIHNRGVQAHVGPEGVFLSDGSAWHPRPLDGGGGVQLHLVETRIEPLAGWASVASGDPVGDGALDEPRWTWRTPRPVDGVAIAANRHRLHGVVHRTVHGPVEIVMHVPETHLELAPMFVDAAAGYLDLYVPRLGPFPFARFSIVENFFSSGFAYPGFTLLGPRVVGMAPRSLAPGYLDHELLHNWWGNGVYVDPEDGNWCEALTSFCANYWRRIAEDGPDAGRAYRRGILMKLAADPAGLDAGPLGTFGLDDDLDRFVGYDKGAFVFAMLGDAVGAGLAPGDADDPMWATLRRFADAHQGRRAGWDDLQRCFEQQDPAAPAGWLDGFFAQWVRRHTVPPTVPGDRADAASRFPDEVDLFGGQRLEIDRGAEDGTFEIDPDFRIYRLLPPEQIIPTVAGTFGAGGVAAETEETRPAVTGYVGQLDLDAAGENLLLIGAGAIRARAALLDRGADPLRLEDGAFMVGGERYDDPDAAVLHTVPHPDRPGRFVTLFHSNGEAGWSRLRLIRFYSRDTTIVWRNDQVVARRVYEPSRRLP